MARPQSPDSTPSVGWQSRLAAAQLGARPLRRLVQTAIGDQLAKLLLAGKVQDGDTVHVGVSEDADQLVLS